MSAIARVLLARQLTEKRAAGLDIAMKRRLCVLFVLAGCGGSTASTHDLAGVDLGVSADDFSVGAADLAVGTDDLSVSTATAVIGAPGGLVSLADGTKIEIPPGALSGNVTITIAPATNSPSNAIGPAYIFGPEGTQFAKGITVTLPYTPSKLVAGATARVATAPATSSSFTSIGGTTSDATHVTASTTHFSTFVVVSYAASGDGGVAMPVAIATAQYLPSAIVSDGSRVFWLNYGSRASNPPTDASVVKYDVGAASTTLLAQNETVNYGVLATDGAAVYWGLAGAATPLVSCAITGCAMIPTGISTSGVGPRGLTVDGTNVYWISSDLYRCPKTGCPGGAPIKLASGSTSAGNPAFLSLGGGSVFWVATNGSVRGVPTSSSAAAEPTPIATGMTNGGITTDTTNVYWFDSGAGKLLACPFGGCPVAGPTVLATDTSAAFIVPITNDGISIFWANPATNKIMRVAIGGGTPTTMAIDQTGLTGIAVDAGHVYWTMSGSYAALYKDGQVVMMQKD